MTTWMMVKESLRLIKLAVRHREWDKAYIVLSWLLEELVRTAREAIQGLLAKRV